MCLFEQFVSGGLVVKENKAISNQERSVLDEKRSG